MQLYVCSICCSEVKCILFTSVIHVWNAFMLSLSGTLYKYAYYTNMRLLHAVLLRIRNCVYTWFQMCLYSLQICIVFSSLKLTLWEFEKLKRNRSTAFTWFCCLRLLIVRFILFYFYFFIFLRDTNLIDIEDRLIFERKIWLRICDSYLAYQSLYNHLTNFI